MSDLPQGVLHDLFLSVSLYAQYSEALPLISLREHQHFSCCCQHNRSASSCACSRAAFLRVLLAWELACRGEKLDFTARNVRKALDTSLSNAWGIAGFLEPSFVPCVLAVALNEFDYLVQSETAEQKNKVEEIDWRKLRPSFSFKTQVRAKEKGKYCLQFGITPHCVQVEWDPPLSFLGSLNEQKGSSRLLYKLHSRSEEMVEAGKKACTDFLERDTNYYASEIIAKTEEIQEWTNFPLCETLWATLVSPDEYTSLIICLVDNFSKAHADFCKKLKERFGRLAASSGFGYGYSAGVQIPSLAYKERVADPLLLVTQWMQRVQRQLQTRYDPLASKPFAFLEERLAFVFDREPLASALLEKCCQDFVAENTAAFMSLSTNTLNTQVLKLVECLKRAGKPADIKGIGQNLPTKRFNGLLLQQMRQERVESLFWAFLVIYLVIGCSLETLRTEIRGLLYRFDSDMFAALQELISLDCTLQTLHQQSLGLQVRVKTSGLYKSMPYPETPLQQEIEDWRRVEVATMPPFQDLLFPHSREYFVDCWKKNLRGWAGQVRSRWLGCVSRTFVEGLLVFLEQEPQQDFSFFVRSFLTKSFITGFLAQSEAVCT